MKPSKIFLPEQITQLYEYAESVTFYNERYRQGYMEEWSIEKKQQIFEIVHNLQLPDTGEAIDFGCGNGILTDIIREALPSGWKIYGTDISPIAIKKAQNHYPRCNFFVKNDTYDVTKKFDLLFTHHVLEHVYNLDLTIKEIDTYVKDDALMLHILPCGNPGSYEYFISVLHKNGINPNLENRFFFEDEGHVRRLTSDQLCYSLSQIGFVLTDDYYANQYYGAINWITQTKLRILKNVTDSTSAIDEHAKKALKKQRFRLLLIWILRYRHKSIERLLHKKNKNFQNYLMLIPGIFLFACTKPMNYYIEKKSNEEWIQRKGDKNGSEMYLFFKRDK